MRWRFLRSPAALAAARAVSAATRNGRTTVPARSRLRRAYSHHASSSERSALQKPEFIFSFWKATRSNPTLSHRRWQYLRGMSQSQIPHFPMATWPGMQHEPSPLCPMRKCQWPVPTEARYPPGPPLAFPTGNLIHPMGDSEYTIREETPPARHTHVAYISRMNESLH
jgi:hypothetical protein